MQIERMTTTLRPRTRWEAVDLGFSMAQQWFLPLLLLWLAGALPVFILCSILLYDSPFWAITLCWWLKPLYEQPLLYYLSRALFGEYPSLKGALKQYWHIAKPQLFAALGWRRLNPARSFNNPVAMLEGLHGSPRKQRLHVLHFAQRSTAEWMHILCYHFEVALWLTLCSLLLILLPEDSSWLQFDDFWDYESALAGLISNVFYLLAMAIIAPFYVAAGFALYLTRRTELEGWDIELNFKKLRERLARLSSPAVTAMLCLGLAASAFPPAAEALEREEAKASIEAILQQDDFGEIKTRYTWEPIEEVEKEEEELDADWVEKIEAFFEKLFDFLDTGLPLLGNVLQALMWITVIALALYLIVRFTNWLDWLGVPQIQRRQRNHKPATLFGLEVKADSLPADLCAEVMQLIEAGQLRDALSLLYRASLIQLIHIHQLEIPESATEGECLRQVQQDRPDEEAHYFARLTRTWLLLAYAHEPPPRDALKQLCQEWPQHYEVVHEPA